MKMIPLFQITVKKAARLGLIVWLIAGCGSCIREYSGEDEGIPDNEPFPITKTGYDFDTFMFRYDNNDGTYYDTKYTAYFSGVDIDYGWSLPESDDSWDHMAGVKVKDRQFLALHNGKKEFSIRPWSSDGRLLAETDCQKWQGNDEIFLGFHVGDRGFISGQSK